MVLEIGADAGQVMGDGDPNWRSASASPIPDRFRSFGVLIAPALMITSRRARMRGPGWRVFVCSVSTPSALPLSMITRLTRLFGRISRLRRPHAGRSQAVAALTRLPRSIMVW